MQRSEGGRGRGERGGREEGGKRGEGAGRRSEGGGGRREEGEGEGVRVVEGGGRREEGGGGGRRSMGRESSLCVWKCVRLAGRKYNNFQGKPSPNVAVVTFTLCIHNQDFPILM